MKTKTLRRLFSMLAALVMGLSLLTGCSEKNAERTQEQEDAQTIQVYLWSTSLYENYAPYVQAQLPDVNIEFIVGNKSGFLQVFAAERRSAGYHHLLPLLAARCGTVEGQPDEPCHDQ